MKYRKLGKSPFEISEVGIGCRGLIGRDLDGMKRAVDLMLELGVNFVDLYSPNPEFRTLMGRALMNRRGNFIIQAHIGTIWKDGKYHYSRVLSEAEKGFSDQLRTLATGHAEIGVIHNVESPEDLDVVLNGDIMKFAQRLKELGTIGCVGMSTFDANTALLAAKSGGVDTIMLAANFYTDRLDDNDKFTGDISSVRKELYEYCDKNGIGLSLMNVFKAGELLQGDSPLGKPLTVHQCLAYALNTPSVASAVCSALNGDEVREACAYLDLSQADKDKILKSLEEI